MQQILSFPCAPSSPWKPWLRINQVVLNKNQFSFNIARFSRTIFFQTFRVFVPGMKTPRSLLRNYLLRNKSGTLVLASSHKKSKTDVFGEIIEL